MQTEKLPLSLKRDPITSAIFELRFTPKVEGFAEIIPGLLYTAIGSTFSRVANLPFAEVPPQIRTTFPDWEFQPTKQLSTSDGRININISGRSVVIEALRPYPGWQDFRTKICGVVQNLHKSDFIAKTERYSLRYQNILPADVLSDLSGLNLEVKIAEYDVEKAGLNLRSEINYRGARAILNIGADVTATLNVAGNVEQVHGVMLDIDLLMVDETADFLSYHEERLDLLHIKEKEIFFSLIKESVLEKLQPVWGK